MKKFFFIFQIKIGSLLVGLSIVLFAIKANGQIFDVNGASSPVVAKSPAASSVVSPRAVPNNVVARPVVQNPDRARVQVKPVIQNGAGNTQAQDTEPQEIRLTMRDFKISKNLNGSISCQMTFYIYSTMKEAISNISYRLNWPNMETPLSFNAIQPKTAMTRKYALLGKGCYEMDKTPNIIVNRCRIKGMTQQACANAIRWVK